MQNARFFSYLCCVCKFINLNIGITTRPLDNSSISTIFTLSLEVAQYLQLPTICCDKTVTQNITIDEFDYIVCCNANYVFNTNNIIGVPVFA